MALGKCPYFISASGNIIHCKKSKTNTAELLFRDAKAMRVYSRDHCECSEHKDCHWYNEVEDVNA